VAAQYGDPSDPTRVTSFAFAPGANFGKPTDASQWTPGRSLQFTLGLKF